MTKYCGIFRVVYPDYSGFTWRYVFSSSPTEAKKALLAYQEGENKDRKLLCNDSRIELEHIVDSTDMYGAELMQQYKEEIECETCT